MSQNDVNDFTKPTRISLNSSFQFNPISSNKFKNNNSFTFDQSNAIQNSAIDNTLLRKANCNKSTTSNRSFVPSHRKSSSLGASVILPNRNGGYLSTADQQQQSLKKPEIVNYENRFLIDDALLEENSDLASLYKEELKFNKVPSISSSSQNNRILDESSCEQNTSISINQSVASTNNQTINTINTLDSLNSQSAAAVTITTTFENSLNTDTDRTENDLDNESDSNSLLPKNLLNIKYQGYIKRKTVLKEGKKPTLTNFWIRYWVILNSTSLIFYSSKSLRGCSRSHFKSTPTKCLSLRSSLITVKLDEEASSMDTFILTDDNDKTIYKFKTNTQLEAITFVREISQVLANPSLNNF